MEAWRDNRNGWRTKTLFVEHLSKADQEKHQPPYTLKEYDIEHNGLKCQSLYRLFMESTDEYEFATKYLGGTAHLKSLRKSKWFDDGHRTHKGYKDWLEDMRMRDESLAKKAIMLAIQEGKVQAANKLWDQSTKNKQNKESLTIRETKARIKNKVTEEEEFLDDVSSRLNVIKFRD